MSKGSRLSRAIQFFREADVDEARVAFQLVKEVMDQRLAPTPKVRIIKPRGKRKLKVNGQDVPAGESITVNASGPVA